FAQPLGDDLVHDAFNPQFVKALAGQSPLGVPTIYGLLMRVADGGTAKHAFERTGLSAPLTDREVPLTLRRSLPSDRPADPRVKLGQPNGNDASKPPPS